MKTENQIKAYKWRESGTRAKWALELYHVYPDIPKGGCGRGPYCINVVFVKAKDRKAYEKMLFDNNAQPVENF